MPEATTGWDRFLTAQDRMLLERTTWAKSAAFGLGARPAIVVVDMYYAALGLPRKPLLEAIADWPAACGQPGWEAVDRTGPLLELARSLDVPIFYLTGLAGNPNPWNRKQRVTLQPARSADSVDRLEIVDELAPQLGDIVLEKCTPSGFASTGLDILLTERGIDTVLVCGEATSGCVRATGVDACVLGYAVGVIGDCCFDRIEASHWMSLFDLDQKYADVLEADAVDLYLRGIA
jgi:maleamate amidohydrolase